MSQSWRGAPRPSTGWENYGYSRNRRSDDEAPGVIAAFDCWCQGDICTIDPETKKVTWPGIEEGKPHPRK